MGIDFQQVSNTLGKQIDAAQSKMGNLLKTADVSNMKQMLQVQMQMSQYEMEVSTQASITKTIKDSVDMVANKM